MYVSVSVYYPDRKGGRLSRQSVEMQALQQDKLKLAHAWYIVARRGDSEKKEWGVINEYVRLPASPLAPALFFSFSRVNT